MTFEYVFSFEIGEREVEATIEVEFSAGYNGIGAYEFWGQRCFDKGEVEIEIESTSLMGAIWLDNGQAVEPKNPVGWQRLIARKIEEQDSNIIEAAAEYRRD